MKTIISLFVLLIFSIESEATLINDKKGFWITPKAIPQNNLVLKNGEDFTFEGSICVVKWGTFGNEKCLKIPSSKAVFKAYYPDSLHDVSNQLDIAQSHDKKTWKYKFKTGVLKDIDLNQFTLTVGSSSKKADDLLKVKAKFEKRILILKNFRNQYVGNTKHHKNISYLTDLISYLELLVSRIDLSLESNPDILAQIRQPIQVENKLSGPMIYSSNFSGHKITMKIPVGVLFEGEKSTIESSVTNLSDKSFYFPGFENDEDDNDNTPAPTGDQSYRLSIELDGQNLIQTQPFSLGFGQTKTVSVLTNKLSPNSTNKIRTHLERSSSGRFDFFSFFNRRLGSLSYDLGVVEDNVAPDFFNIKPLAGSYHKTLPEIEAVLKDLKGRIDISTVMAKFKGTKIDGASVEKTITNQLLISNQGANDNYLLKGNSGAFEEGRYELIFLAEDYAGNSVTKEIQNIVYDSTAPVINLQANDNRLTNQSVFNISATAFDHNPGETKITQNGTVVYTTNSVVVDYDAQLSEGLNIFEIESVDAAGNVAVKKGLYNIVLDTVPPVLSDIIPSSDANIYSLSFNTSGKSNEALSLVKVNGKIATIGGDAKSFNANLVALIEGDYPIEIVATDKALNTSTFSLNVKLVLKVLNIDLVSISPDPNNADKLIITGAPGASRPGAEIRLYSGFFNQKTITSNSIDGSFETALDYFNSLELRVYDAVLNRTETGNLAYNVDTTLAGVIKDTENHPLPGVKVTIASSGQQATTDSAGSFRIPMPATGDQILNLDGTVIPVAVSGPNKKYSRVNIAVSIGTRQSNVLDKPLYLAPLMFDGSETIIADPNTSVTVESPHAPGVSLEVPAGVATFPDSKKIGVISVAEINADYSAVPVLDFAKPQTVYAFEPSGLKFSEPVQLTLPNVNEIPAGVQMVIISKNSEKGIWEIDGLARVSDDGSEIVTEANGGITHFSEIYAAPLGPQISEYAGTSHPGADTMNGALQNSIEIPSYKIFGKDLVMNLSYRSSWANPTVVVSNIIDVPRNEYEFSYSNGVRNLIAKANQSISGKSWIEPDFIDAKFYTDSITSQKMTFAGIPNKSVISYAMNLSSLDTGLKTFNSHYDIHLKQMIVGTRVTTTKKLFGKTKVYQESFSETRQIEEVFPQDMGGSIYVQNYQNSAAGKGWRVNGAGSIYNLESPTLLVEESDGTTTSYAVNSNIETIYHNANKNLTASDLSNWPNIKLYSDNDKNYYNFSATSNAVTNIGVLSDYSGRVEGLASGLNVNFVGPTAGDYSCSVSCSIEYALYSKPRVINNIFSFGNRSYVLSNEGNISIYEDQSLVQTSGKLKTPTSNLSWIWGGDPWPVSACEAEVGTSCYGFNYNYRRGTTPTRSYYTELMVPVYECPYVNIDPSNEVINVRELNKVACKNHGIAAQSTGQVPVPGFEDGLSPAFNSLSSATKGSGNEILLSDFGNNRIRALNIITGAARTIAGNGQTYDNGDGNFAISASVYHPRGLAKDSQGNIYVSSERGFIRKIDVNGYISTFAGKLNGVLSSKSQAQDMLLNNPYGLIIDNTKNLLFVADTGHHRVVKIDLVTREATTVAGTGTCQSGNIGDGKSALFASLCNPTTLGLDDQQNLLIFDRGHNRIRKVNFENANNGTINFQPLAQDNSTLTKLANGHFLRKFRNGSEAEYDVKGKQISSQDRVGNKFVFSYFSSGNLARVTDSTNRTTEYQYLWGKLAGIVDPQGRETKFNYDGDLLTQVRFPDGSERSFEYDNDGLMTNETDKRGSLTTYQYNQWKRLQNVIKADGSSVTLQDGVSATIGNNYISGQIGILKSINKNEIVDGIRDSKGHVTTLNKYESGFVSKIIDPKGAIYKIERDFDGRPLKITRPDDSYSTFTYDPIYHDLVSKSDSLTGVSLTFQYDIYGNLLNQTLPSGDSVSFDYDDNTGLLISKIMPLNVSESYEYYSNGLIKAKINALGQRNSFAYGSFGNLVTLTDNMNQVTQLTRDSSGNVISSTNAKGQTTEYNFDVSNRLKAVKSPKNEVTSYEYLPSGELAKIIDPEENETIYEYDLLGRLKKKTDSLGLHTTLAYDINGNIVKEIDPSGQVKTFEYDNSDRLIKKILPDDIYEFSYDVRDNIESIKNSRSIIRYEYAHLENGDVVTKEICKGLGGLSDLPQSDIEYDYDESGNRVEMATNEGNFFYSYDKLSRLTKVVNHRNEIFDFSYDQGSRLTQQRSPASSTNYAFDNVNFLTQVSHKKRSNSAIISQFDFTRDGIGNITKMTTTKGDYNFAYDNNNQLINATHPEDVTSSFVYDSLGNRITDQFGNFNYDSKKQRLQEDWKYLYAYDDNGNISSKILKSDNGKVVNYIHNSLNQLISIKNYDGTSVVKESKYYYDAIGRRVKKEHMDVQSPSANFASKYIYDNQQILFELDENNSLLSTFTHSLLRVDDMLSVDKNGASYFYLKDHLGSISEMLNSSGDLVQRYVYSPFGKILKIENGNGQDITATPMVENFYTFTGREIDRESGLYYYRARYYDSDVGRFLAVDPDRGNIGSPGSFNNKYNYVGNNPLNYTDPSGAIKFKTLVAAYFLGPLGGAYTLARETFLDNRHGARLDNIIIASAVVVGAFYTAPATAGVALSTTAVQNRNKEGNFFDNLDEFATDYAINFGVALAFNEIFPSGTSRNYFGVRDIVSPAAFMTSIGTGIGGVVAKETICNNTKHIPGGVIGKVANGLGGVADRGKAQCD